MRLFVGDWSHAVQQDHGGYNTIIGTIKGDPDHVKSMTPVSWISKMRPRGHGAWITGLIDGFEPGDRARDSEKRKMEAVEFSKKNIKKYLEKYYNKCYCPAEIFSHFLIEI